MLGNGFGGGYNQPYGRKYPASRLGLHQHSLRDSPMAPRRINRSEARRDFLKTSAGLGAFSILSSGVHASSASVLKIGLVGCGGRGTGAASQALRADKETELVAVGDMFDDRLQGSLAQLKGDGEIGARVKVSPDACFTGFDAYKKVIDSGVDVVLLASPPGFRPMHIEAAVAAGKHIFAEKPVAVDGPGCRRVLEACRQAKEKNLAVVSGLCWRYDRPKRETMKRIHDGALGELHTLHTNYNVGSLWMRKRQPTWTDMEYQLRNWYYYAWLSGDHNVEQHIHSLDKCRWALKDENPIAAYGLGGRQVRNSSDFGHIFDHHAVVYEFKSGAKVFSYTRQQDGCYNDVNDYFQGSKGFCNVMKHTITGPDAWTYRRDGAEIDMYQSEHNELFASIRAGKPINDGEWMTHSSLMAILGRMATYTGKRITWEQALNSKEVLAPGTLVLDDQKLPTPPVALPGKTPFA